MTIDEQNRYQPLPRNGNERVYPFDFDYDNPEWILVEWGTSEDRELWKKLTLGTDYTITKTFGGGQVTLLVDPDSLVDIQGLPFAWLSIQSDYPYSQTYALPNNYSMGSIDLILTYMEIQIQQVWSIVEQILTIPGLWISFRLVAPPNEKGRIPKIDSDDGTMLFRGSALIDDGSKVVSEIDFYVNQNTYLRGNADISGDLSVIGATDLTGNLTGSNAYFSGNITASGTGTFNLVVANQGNIDVIFSDTINVDVINSTTINNSGNITNLGLLETNTAKVNSTLNVKGVSHFEDTVNVPDLISTISVTAPVITGTELIDAARFITLRGTKFYPNLSLLNPGDLISAASPTGGSNSQFDLVPRKISGASGIVNVSTNRLAIGGAQTNPMLPALVNSDLYETIDTVVVDTKHLEVATGDLDVVTGNLEVATGDLKVVGQDSVIEHTSGYNVIQGKNILWRTDTFRNGYVLAINELIIDGELVYEIISVPGGGGGNILVTKDVYAKGGDAGNLADSDTIEIANVVHVSTKNFQIDLGSLLLPSGLISLAGTMLKVDLGASISGQVLTLAPPLPGEESLYNFILTSTAGGGGGGGSIGTVSLNTFPIGDGVGTLQDSSMTQTADSISINAKNLFLNSGALDLPSGNITLGGLKLHSDLINTAAPGVLLSLMPPNLGEENDYDYLLTSSVGAGSNISENVFAMGGATGTGLLSNAPVGLQNTDIISQTGWSFRSGTLKCDRMRLNPAGYYFSMGYDPQANTKNVNATWNVNLDWMNAGEIKGVSLRKVDDENCILFPLAEAPPIPTTPGQTWVENSVASFGGWDPYQERQIYSNNVALVYDNVVENWDFQVANVKTVAHNYLSITPTVSGQDVVLTFNPNLQHIAVVSFTDSITEIVFSQPLFPGTTLILYFVCDESGKSVTFPSSWYWPDGCNKMVTTAHKMVAVDVYCSSDNEIYAQFIRAGNTFDTGTIRPIPPFNNFGVAKYDTIFGGQMSSSTALAYEDTIENWNVPLAKVKNYSSTKRVLTASNGTLVIPLDGDDSAFEYTHDTDLTSIHIAIDSAISSANLAWNLRIITGASSQRDLPVPDGCMVAEDVWTIKEGNAFVSGFWTNTRMFVMPISSFDFTV